MARIKRGKTHLRKRKRILKLAKGYKWGRKSKIRLAKTAVIKAGVYAFRDRRVKKRESRKLWQIQINAATRQHNLSYSRFINQLKKAKIEIDRKILANLAIEEPKIFSQIVKEVSSK